MSVQVQNLGPEDLEEASEIVHKFWSLNSEFEPTNELKDKTAIEEIRKTVTEEELLDTLHNARKILFKDSPTLKGYQLYHNFIGPHMSLEGKTPAEMRGIKVEGDNKWKTIIQNASQSTQFK